MTRVATDITNKLDIRRRAVRLIKEIKKDEIRTLNCSFKMKY